jgi:hypothetical protein
MLSATLSAQRASVLDGASFQVNGARDALAGARFGVG